MSFEGLRGPSRSQPCSTAGESSMASSPLSRQGSGIDCSRIVSAQPCPRDLACLLIDGMCHHRKCVHIQPDTRTLNNHRRPPDLQMWLYQRECPPTPATHESFCSTRPSASAGPYTVYSCGDRARQL